MSFFEIHDPQFGSYVMGNAPVKRLATGFDWVEGPVWFGDQNCLLFSDIPNNRILRFTPGAGISTYRAPSNYANGHTRDRQGRLVSCEHGTRRVTRTEWDGQITVIADGYGGKRLNSPNDVVVRSDGLILFTDPPYGLGQRQSDLGFSGVFALDEASGRMVLIDYALSRPNGLALSPDEKVLYVGDTASQSLWAYDIAADGSAKPGARPAAREVQDSSPAFRALPPDTRSDVARETVRSTLSQSGKPMRTQPPGVSVSGQPEQLKGVRRNMARVMADAHSKVVPTTLCDDADLHAWLGKQDITARLVRAIVTACQTVPALNAWFDGDNLSRTLHPNVDIGVAVDTDDGLFVPALRNADLLDAGSVRESINRLRAQVEDRSIPPSELTGYTISLSNFGMFAGRYATPVVVPPCVAIVAAGRARHQVTPVMGGFESHKVIPLSVTFDHRACTGGEAARFLKALIDDLALPY